jgi:hypothetical protein
MWFFPWRSVAESMGETTSICGVKMEAYNFRYAFALIRLRKRVSSHRLREKLMIILVVEKSSFLSIPGLQISEPSVRMLYLETKLF